MLCADFGAHVLRIDRAHPQAHTDTPPPPSGDQLNRRKSSIAVNTKTAAGVALVKQLVQTADIVIEPFRPGVLEKMGLGPQEVMLKLNPRLIVARMTGFRRDGKYKDMAGHDINYIAVSGALSMLGRQGEKPYAPGNILGDFAGGGAICFLGIVLALLYREKTGYGQIVEANMVDGASFLATMPRLATKLPVWSGPRGTNQLDGGCPYYDTYETKDGRYMAVGALEPQFYAALLKGLEIDEKSVGGNRLEKKMWPKQKEMFTAKFKSKTREEWEKVFDGTDACCTPVLTQRELEQQKFDQRPIVTLRSTPGLAIQEGEPENRPEAEGQGIGVEGNGWDEKGLSPGVGGEDVLARWMGWSRGRHYDLKDGALEYIEKSSRAKL
jgi:alpha-methylacyl-CoA racemase